MSSEPQTSLPTSTSQHTLSLDSIQPIQSPPPPEIEATLSRLSAYRNVRGVMILSRSPAASYSSTIPNQSNTTNTTEAESSSSSGGIIQMTGNVFQGESGKKYAKAIESIVGNVSKSLNECEQGDELKFMRIRTKKHELIITPDEKYLLVVLQDPGQ